MKRDLLELALLRTQLICKICNSLMVGIAYLGLPMFQQATNVNP